MKTKRFKIGLTWQMIIAMALGIGLGILFRENASHVKVLGDIFLKLIQMSVVILIMGAVVEAVGKLKPAELGKMGLRILFWFTVSTLIAACIGFGLGFLFQPGVHVSLPLGDAPLAEKQSVSELLLSFFPSNIIGAMGDGNIIQVIVFSMLFGVGLSAWREKKGGSRMLVALEEFNAVIIEMITRIMKIAPIGIGALMAATTGSIGMKVLLPLLGFLLVFGVGALIHLAFCIAFTAMYCRVGIPKILKGILRMTVVAVTTTSSAVTLPTKMKDSEQKLGVSKRVSDLVNPLGMTLNSNGLAMFLSLSMITIAQIYGIEITLPFMIKTVLLASLACLGTVVVPGGGIVALTVVVPALGLPPQSIAILAGIDWFSGMFRTVLNVDIDALASMLIAKSVKELDYGILRGEKGDRRE
jgi:Na+/H+-dicarboxylate symporter